MLKRKISKTIIKYFNDDNAPILCIYGARQVGKSYIIRSEGKKYYPNFIEINLADDFNNDQVFSHIKSADDLYLQLNLIPNTKLGTYKDTIIFLDEIQIYPHILTMLKKLNIDHKYKFICSGSELGIALKKTTLIPIGSIYEVKMYPLDFEEFLWANKVDEEVLNHLYKCYKNITQINESTHISLMKYFKYFLFVGGLPEAVDIFVSKKDILKISQLHNDIINYYKEDASKYDFENKLSIKAIYDFMASNLTNKIKRLTFNKIQNIKDARYLKYEAEIEYLISSAIINDVYAISEPRFPLIQASSKNLIKLYYNDIGLLSSILYNYNINAILFDKGPNLGAVYETFVAQELAAHNHKLYYYDRKKFGEVDFLVNDYDNLCVLPIEVKSGKDSNNFRALPKLINIEEYNINKGIVLSNNSSIRIENKILYMPIYMVMFI